jgi:hypothetical protein
MIRVPLGGQDGELGHDAGRNLVIEGARCRRLGIRLTVESRLRPFPGAARLESERLHLPWRGTLRALAPGANRVVKGFPFGLVTHVEIGNGSALEIVLEACDSARLQVIVPAVQLQSTLSHPFGHPWECEEVI